MTLLKHSRLALAALTFLAGCSSAPNPQEAQRLTQSVIQSSFREQGIAKLDRLNQDAVQQACSSPEPPSEAVTKQPGAGIGFGSWPAYRVSSGDLWSMQRRLNDCYRQQRFPFPGYASDATIALGVYMGVNSKGGVSIAPALKR